MKLATQLKPLKMNHSAIRVAKIPLRQRRQKHVDVKFYFIREKANKQNNYLIYFQTPKQIADIFPNKCWN